MEKMLGKIVEDSEIGRKKFTGIVSILVASWDYLFLKEGCTCIGTEVTCRKLEVMQVILVHRKTNCVQWDTAD